jgi:hypothetical protein
MRFTTASVAAGAEDRSDVMALMLREGPAEQVGGAGPGDTLSGVMSRFTIAAPLALFLGWIAREDWLRPAMGLEDIDEESLA